MKEGSDDNSNRTYLNITTIFHGVGWLLFVGACVSGDWRIWACAIGLILGSTFGSLLVVGNINKIDGLDYGKSFGQLWWVVVMVIACCAAVCFEAQWPAKFLNEVSERIEKHGKEG